MDLSKIKKGKVFNTYKEICTALNEPIKSSHSKKSQLENWERYFEFDKQGRKFVITKVFKVPKLKLSSSTCREITKALTLDLLIHSETSPLQISRNKLIKQLELVNENYFNVQYKQKRLSTFTNIPVEDIKDFYTSSDNFLKNNIEKALAELKNEGAIIYDNVTFICKHLPIIDQADNGESMTREKVAADSYGDNNVIDVIDGSIMKEYRPATEEEKQFILKTTDDLLDEYISIIRAEKKITCDKNISEVIRYGYSNAYFAEVKKILKQKYNISFYFQAYQISFNQEKIIKRWKQECKELGTQSKKKHIRNVNQSICEKLNTNAEKRNENAYIIKPSEENKPLNLTQRKHRSDQEYLDNEFLLTKLLIDHETEVFNENFYRKLT